VKGCLAGSEDATVEPWDSFESLARKVEADELTNVLGIEAEGNNSSDNGLGDLCVCEGSVDGIGYSETNSTSQSSGRDCESGCSTDEERRS
jgi:hypothetical protein